MDVQEKQLKTKLISKRKAIKKKLALLRHGEIVKNEMFSPITRHLKTIESKLETGTRKTKNSQMVKDDMDDNSVKSDVSLLPSPDAADYDEEMSMMPDFSPKNVFSSTIRYDDDDDINKKETPRKKKAIAPKKNILNFSAAQEASGLKRSILEEIKEEGETEEEEEEDNPYRKLHKRHRGRDIAERSFRDYLEQYDSLPRKYISKMILDENNEFDHKYGVRHNPVLEKFYIGDSQLFFDGSDIIVKNKKYKGTRGLYELLFKKHPKEFTENDEKAYKDVVLKTNAHRRYYQASKQVDGSKLIKYKKIIAPLAVAAVTASTTGKGMFMEVTNNNIDYVHWDDPNELVERLRLLIASQEAGNTSHINEINSIVEELREAKIIV